jgi:hypothetical protein
MNILFYRKAVMRIFYTDKVFQRHFSAVFTAVLLFFLFVGTTLNAQDYGFNPALRTAGNDTNIKSISAKYKEGRVYLMIFFKGIKNDRYYVVKRSVDGNNFETIGGIKSYGTSVPVEMMCSFTDNYPVYSFIYYKIVYYTGDNDSLYSETVGVLAGTDKNSLYVTIDNDIWVINQKNDKMVPLKLDINTKETECNATLSPDENTIYFVSDRKGGYGGKDIWASEKLSNGQWSEPYNLGKEINSAEDEDFPLIQDDGVTLYFSIKTSDNYNSYFSTQNDEGLWDKPENIELLQNESKDYYSLINGTVSGRAYTYHTKKENAIKNPSVFSGEKK